MTPTNMFSTSVPFASAHRLRGLGALILAAGLLLFTGCDSGGSDMEETDDLRKISYDLTAQSNSGDLPDGVDATVTIWEVSPRQSLITLELDEGDGSTGTTVSHPAHIHNNSASEGGDIAIYLTPIDGSGGDGTSARVVNQSFEALADFDGYVNIHESVSSLGTVISQGDIGANADGEEDEGLELVESPRTTSYDLSAKTNSGAVAPNGISGQAIFQELTDDLTLVSLALNADGATGADVSHPAHIHNNSASEGGDIEFYLGPVDGSDPNATGSKLVEASYDTLVEFDGYINIHESVGNLGAVVSQGNVGANAGDDGSDDSGGGY